MQSGQHAASPAAMSTGNPAAAEMVTRDRFVTASAAGCRAFGLEPGSPLTGIGLESPGLCLADISALQKTQRALPLFGSGRGDGFALGVLRDPLIFPDHDRHFHHLTETVDYYLVLLLSQKDFVQGF